MKKSHEPNKLGLYASDTLRNKVWKKGDEVFFLLFPYNNSDNIKIFYGEITRVRTNTDLTNDYVIRIKNAFEKRELLRDFFHNNWFRTANKSTEIQQTSLNEGVQMFSFIDTELVDEVRNSNFCYGKYKTFFKNHGDRFIFWVNESFIFDKYNVALDYLTRMNFLTVGKKLKELHDILVSRHNQRCSSIYYKTSQIFIQEFKPLLFKLIDDMGPEFEKYKKTNMSLYKFFDEYILNRQTRRIEFSKSKKMKSINKATKEIWREKLKRD